MITPNTPLWLGTLSDSPFPMPYWAFVWPGSYGIIRYLEENPSLVRGKRVLDFASGCGIAGLMAKKLGATEVVCNDIDTWAAEACQVGQIARWSISDSPDNSPLTLLQLNAELNGIDEIILSTEDLIGTACQTDIILAGDVCYDDTLAAAVCPWLAQRVREGTKVLLGDPGRHFLPDENTITKVAGYDLPGLIKDGNNGLPTGYVWEVN
jgi:predicted nicotinamide N-methyase